MTHGGNLWLFRGDIPGERDELAAPAIKRVSQLENSVMDASRRRRPLAVASLAVVMLLAACAAKAPSGTRPTGASMEPTTSPISSVPAPSTNAPLSSLGGTLGGPLAPPSGLARNGVIVYSDGAGDIH